MKLILLNDVHIGGARNDSETVAEHQSRFFNQILFPYMLENSIEHIVVLGDLFERRKYINFKSLKRAHEMFFMPAQKHGFKISIMVGNHDVADRHSNEVNSPALLLQGYSNISLFDVHNPQDIRFDENDKGPIGIMPWIASSPEAEERAANFLRTSMATVIFGHFDIIGFEMSPGAFCEDGIDPRMFDRFDAVYTGHYHNKTSKGNIHYLGTQYEMDWNDYGHDKFFHVFDTSTHEIMPVINPNRLFVKLHWNDGWLDIQDTHKKFVKVVVLKKTNVFEFETAMAKLRDTYPEAIQVIDSTLVENQEVLSVDSDDIDVIIRRHVDDVQESVEFKQQLSSLMTDLLKEARAT